MRTQHYTEDNLPAQVAIPADHRFIDITGKKFGRLTVIYYTGKQGNGNRTRPGWLCRCDCNKYIIALSENLRKGVSRSCGCYRTDITIKRSTTHGKKHSDEYIVWDNMRQRCNNPNNKAYKYYGGRGIKIAKEWNDFAVFYEDMGPRPTPKHTIERVDVNGDYCRDNCIWELFQNQARNKRNIKKIKYNNEEHCLAEWAKRFNIDIRTLYSRIYILGWSIDRAFTTPIRVLKQKKHA